MAHGHVDKIKIEGKWFISFSAMNKNKNKNEYVLKAQIQQSKLGSFISALKSTVKDLVGCMSIHLSILV